MKSNSRTSAFRQPAKRAGRSRALAEAASSGCDTLEAHVHKMKKQHPDLVVAFNATGGFKAETAILYGRLRPGHPGLLSARTYKVPIVLPVCAVPF